MVPLCGALLMAIAFIQARICAPSRSRAVGSGAWAPAQRSPKATGPAPAARPAHPAASDGHSPSGSPKCPDVWREPRGGGSLGLVWVAYPWLNPCRAGVGGGTRAEIAGGRLRVWSAQERLAFAALYIRLSQTITDSEIVARLKVFAAEAEQEAVDIEAKEAPGAPRGRISSDMCAVCLWYLPSWRSVA